MPCRSWRVAAACLALVSGVSLPAGAQAPGDGPITLDWSAPADACPNAQQVRAEIDELLGGAPSGVAGRSVSARARVARLGPDRWRLDLRTQTSGAGTGQRVLHAATCRELAEAAALIVAFAYDPEAVRARGRDVPPAEAAAPPPVPAPPPAPPLPTPPAERAPSEPLTLRPALGAHAAADVGALPVASLGAGISTALLFRSARLELEGTAWLPERVGASARPTVGGRFTFLSAALTGGPRLSFGAVELAACAGAELGSMHATGYGVAQPGEASELWRAVRAGIVVVVTAAPWLGVRLELAALVPLDRPRWILEQVGEVGRTAALTGRGKAGVEVKF